jgi:hypothetical protein
MMHKLGQKILRAEKLGGKALHVGAKFGQKMAGPVAAVTALAAPEIAAPAAAAAALAKPVLKTIEKATR